MRVWDIDTGRPVWEKKGHAIDVFDVAYSPDGRWLASAGGGYDPLKPGEARLWDAETGQEIHTFVVPAADVFGVAISPDSRWLAAGCSDGMVRIWDTRDPAGKARELAGHIGQVERVVFLPDGRLASAGGTEVESGDVKIWDLSTGRVLDLRGHTGPVWGLACSPDGRRLVTGSHDRTIKLWDTTTGEEVFTLRGHTGGVHPRGVQPRRPTHRLGRLGPDCQGLGHKSSGVRRPVPARGRVSGQAPETPG